MATGTSREKGTKPPAGAADAVQAAVDYGIDIAQLRDNLALTVAERLRRHQTALETVEMLQRAKQP
jgi:hypothetical protein